MANPASRDQFKEYCLRRLGKPVVDINIDNEQVEDRIDDALGYYRDFHFDGTERVWVKYQLTAADIANEYVPIDSDIIGIVNILDVGDSINTKNLFDIRYQIHLNDLFNFTAGNITPYVMAMRHIETLEEVFVGKKFLRYNRHMDRLFIDLDWNTDVAANDYLIIDAYRVIDPNTYTDVWNDWWLKRYATALIKRQWGENLKKFEGLQLPGGVQFNGQKIWEEAVEEIKQLEDEMINSWSLPVSDMLG